MESLNDALKDCITACGGSKAVGPILWPEKDPLAAQRLLLDCFNEDRPARLSPSQVMLVLRMARAKGHHGGIAYLCAELGYTQPSPIEPKDEVIDLMRLSRELVDAQASIAARMEKAVARISMKAVA